MAPMNGDGLDPSTPGAAVNVPRAVMDQLSDGEWLSSRGAAAAVLGMGAVATGVFALRRTGRRSRREISVLGGIWLGVGAAIANSVFGVMPNLTNLARQLRHWAGLAVEYQTRGGGRVQTIQMSPNPSLKIPATRTWVYTPAELSTPSRQRHPVLYLMHGSPGQCSDWFLLGRVDAVLEELRGAGLVGPMIIVAPDVNGGWVRDVGCVNVRGGPQVETWLYEDLIPRIEAEFPAQPRRTGRIIGGMSSGGYCTLNQGLRHQDKWGVMLAFEPYGELGRSARRLLGADPAVVRAHSPQEFVRTMELDHPLPTYLDVGSRSRVRDVRALAQQLVDRDQTVLFRINHGHGHTWGQVRAGLPYALMFAARQLA